METIAIPAKLGYYPDPNGGLPTVSGEQSYRGVVSTKRGGAVVSHPACRSHASVSTDAGVSE